MTEKKVRGEGRDGNSKGRFEKGAVPGWATPTTGKPRWKKKSERSACPGGRSKKSRRQSHVGKRPGAVRSGRNRKTRRWGYGTSRKREEKRSVLDKRAKKKVEKKLGKKKAAILRNGGQRISKNDGTDQVLEKGVNKI